MTLTDAHHRRKQPEQVRRALLDCAARIAVEQGLANVSIQAVAEAAGVTKGGLFHHFPNKKALVDAVFEDLLEQLDHEIDDYLVRDDHPYGRFTRAYVQAVFSDRKRDPRGSSQALCISMVTDADLRRMWSAWMTDRLERHRGTDTSLQLEIVRLAADGAWLAFMSQAKGEVFVDADALCERLIDLTRQV